MKTVLDLILWLLVAPALLSLAYLSLELLAGLLPLRSTKTKAAPHRDIAFLVPAHNEEGVIGETVADLAAKAPFARILVVADNCTDGTAKEAEKAGAEVIERHDSERRGKGYALAFGRDHLAKDPPRMVAIVDADCTIGEGFAETMIAAVERHGSAVQASNLFTPDLTLAPSVQVSNFAMLVKNLFRMRGMYRLGGSVTLLGTGMAFPWHQFRDLPLATSEAVEDIKLGLDLVADGQRIAFEERAQVWSRAESAADTAGQRTRWEHGFLSHSLRYGLPTLLRGLARFSRSRIALGLHMLVPPLALLVVGTLALLAVAGALHLAGASAYPLIVLVVVFGVAGSLLAAAWLIRGRRYLAGRKLLALPLYILWKLPIYLSFLTKRQKSWDQ